MATCGTCGTDLWDRHLFSKRIQYERFEDERPDDAEVGQSFPPFGTSPRLRAPGAPQTPSQTEELIAEISELPRTRTQMVRKTDVLIITATKAETDAVISVFGRGRRPRFESIDDRLYFDLG